MSGPLAAPRVLPLVSVLYSAAIGEGGVPERLAEYFGRLETGSREYSFDLSDYYSTEMGDELSRRWYCFSPLRDPSELTQWKLECYRLERELAGMEGNRLVNLDPGYLDYGKLVLASFKEAPDKIYMERGVWAHTCLRYGHGEFTAPDHSFPDFKDGRFGEFMLQARNIYRRLMRVSGKSDT